MVYVALIIDVYFRVIVGWRAATSMKTSLVLDALEMALWQRRRDRINDLTGLVHHTDAGSQYTSFAFTHRLIDAGVDPSVGSVGDAFDNALAESQIGLYKAALIWQTARGFTSITSNARPSSGSTGSTRSAAMRPSTTSHRCKQSKPTTLHPNASPRPAETPNEASRMTGAAQSWMA